ncbi:membrane-associated protein, putative [Bodo saltans]|uniref:Membrane-associated protein, putative n=1 Tax=Bodo saltans TaxID=75058 RepID=A0A0S4JFT0_BODSA|nr:membrane-associated protein, putative [Bodo saltans]|eukprot:CUG90426.1 membrane-associated protein, putative [Bodo saltans]
MFKQLRGTCRRDSASLFRLLIATAMLVSATLSFTWQTSAITASLQQEVVLKTTGSLISGEGTSNPHHIAVDAAMVDAAVTFREQWHLEDQKKSHVLVRTKRRNATGGPHAWMCTTAGGGIFEDEATSPRFIASRRIMRRGIVVGYSTFVLPTELCRRPVPTIDLRGGPIRWTEILNDDVEGACAHGLEREPIASVALQYNDEVQQNNSAAKCFAMCMAFRSCTGFSVVLLETKRGEVAHRHCQLFRCFYYRTPIQLVSSMKMEWTPKTSVNNNNESTSSHQTKEHFEILHMILHKRRFVFDMQWFYDGSSNHSSSNHDTLLGGSVVSHDERASLVGQDVHSRHRARNDDDDDDGAKVLVVFRSFGGFVWNLETFDVPFPSNAQVIALDAVYGDVRSDIDATVQLEVVAIDRYALSVQRFSAEEALHVGEELLQSDRFSPIVDDRSDDTICSLWRRSRLLLPMEVFHGAATVASIPLSMISGRARLGGHVLSNMEPFIGSTLCIYAELHYASTVTPDKKKLRGPLSQAFAMKSVRLHRLLKMSSFGGDELPMYLTPYRSLHASVVAGVDCGGADTDGTLWCLRGTLLLSSSPPPPPTAINASMSLSSISLEGADWGSTCVLSLAVVASEAPAGGHHETFCCNVTLDVVEGFYTKFGPFGEALFTNILFRATSLAAQNLMSAAAVAASSTIMIVAKAHLYQEGALLKSIPSGPLMALWNTTLTPGDYPRRQPINSANPPTASLPSPAPILISLAVHECPDCLVQLLANIRLHAMPCAVVVHISAASNGATMTTKMAEAAILAEAELARSYHNISGNHNIAHMPVFINRHQMVIGGAGEHLHLVNFRNVAFMLHSHPHVEWSHVVWMQSNERLLKKGIGSYVRQFDMSVPRVAVHTELAGIAHFHQPLPRYYSLREMLSAAQQHRSTVLIQLRDATRRGLMSNTLAHPLTSSSSSSSSSSSRSRQSPLFMHRIFSPQNILSEGVFLNRSIAAYLSDISEATIDTDTQHSGDSKYIAHEYVTTILLEHAIDHFHLTTSRIGQRTSVLAWGRTNYFVTAEDIDMIRNSAGPPFSAKRFHHHSPAIINHSFAPPI